MNPSRFVYVICCAGAILSLFCMYGCEKIPLDYRNKYVGKYRFVMTWNNWNIGEGVTAHGQENTDGEVYYNKGKESKNLLRVRYKGNTEITVKVDNLGFIFALCDTRIGQIDPYTEELQISWTSQTCGGGAMGGGYGISLVGEKK